MTERDEYPWKLNRTIAIAAPVPLVYEMITTPEYWARWWGAGSRIVAEPGGEVLIRYPNGIEVVGQVVDIRPDARLAFTYGYASGAPVPPGGSIVEIALESDGEGTRLRLTHAFRDETPRDQHDPGWRFQLSIFTNTVLDHLHAGAGERVDAWFAAWAESDPDERRRQFSSMVTPDVVFHDRFSALQGLDDLLAHVSAARKFMPGVCMTRRGPVRHCQGEALADWRAAADGQPRGEGTDLFAFAPDGRIRRVTGFWSTA